jgi:hypothetical protein
MRHKYLVVIACLAIGTLGACGESNDNVEGRPAPPAVGEDQIDRMGRAGVNTALTDPFFRREVEEEELRHEARQDEYNGAADPAAWANMFANEIAVSLAVIDSLDRTCGNQIVSAAQPLGADRYQALAGILADDQLYVNTASGICQQYLAVEANAVGVTNNDCGGRTPLEDTIDTTYSVLALGALAGVGDGVPIDADSAPSLSAFPFLDEPTS